MRCPRPGHEKSDKFRDKVYYTLDRARRSRAIPFSWLRDDNASVMRSRWYGSPADFWDSVARQARSAALGNPGTRLRISGTIRVPRPDRASALGTSGRSTMSLRVEVEQQDRNRVRFVFVPESGKAEAWTYRPGQDDFWADLPVREGAREWMFTWAATATRINTSDTSEFSNARQVVAGAASVHGYSADAESSSVQLDDSGEWGSDTAAEPSE